MKATQSSEPVFKPVTITLETQEEVNALYAFLVHSVLSDAVGLRDQYKDLAPYRTQEYDAYFKTINALIK